MKKFIAIALAVAMVFTILTAGVAYAGSAYSNARADFEPVPDRGVDSAWGHAIINYVKGQGVWVVNGSIQNLLPNRSYIVEVGTQGIKAGEVAATFTTNGRGKANFHNVATDLPDEYNVVRIIDPNVSGWSPRGDIKMVAREDGTLGLLQFRGAERGQ